MISRLPFHVIRGDLLPFLAGIDKYMLKLTSNSLSNSVPRLCDVKKTVRSALHDGMPLKIFQELEKDARIRESDFLNAVLTGDNVEILRYLLQQGRAGAVDVVVSRACLFGAVQCLDVLLEQYSANPVDVVVSLIESGRLGLADDIIGRFPTVLNDVNRLVAAAVWGCVSEFDVDALDWLFRGNRVALTEELKSSIVYIAICDAATYGHRGDDFHEMVEMVEYWIATH